MTIEEAKALFFYEVQQRIRSLESARSLLDVTEIMCPDDIVDDMARGADNLCRELGISNYHNTNSKITYTLNRASDYSTKSLMPLWTKLHNSLIVANGTTTFGKVLDWLDVTSFGEIIGTLVGFKGVSGNGDYLVNNLSAGTDSLISVAEYDFDHHIKPAILSEFGR